MVITLLNRFWKRGNFGTGGHTSTVFHKRFARPSASAQLATLYHGVLGLGRNGNRHD